MEFSASALECCTGADAIVLATEWAEFRDLAPADLAAAARGRIFVDLRNLMDEAALVGAGFTVHGVGRRPRAPGAPRLTAANATPPASQEGPLRGALRASSARA